MDKSKAWWNDFFIKIEEIVNMEGTWREKRDTVREMVNECGGQTEFEEFIDWFMNDK